MTLLISSVVFAIVISSIVADGTIEIKPEFPSRTERIRQGGPLKLTCIYRSITDLNSTENLEFFLDNNPNKIANGVSVIKTTDSQNRILTLEAEKDAVKLDDGGVYICKEMASGKTANITVQVADVKVDEVEYNTNQDNLTCNPEFHPSLGNNVTYVATWTKNNSALNTKRATANGMQLTIENPVWPDDLGQYECTLTFEETSGKEQKVQGFGAVTGQPKIKDFKDSKNVVQGDKMVLKCPVTGYPYPVVTWYKDAIAVDFSINRIKAETYDHVKNAKLIVDMLEFSDKGKYKCYVNTTYAGHNNTEAVIDIKVKDRLAALWPFLGIVAEVVVLCLIIFIYEKKRSKEMENEDDIQDEKVANNKDHKDKDIRQRNVKA